MPWQFAAPAAYDPATGDDDWLISTFAGCVLLGEAKIAEEEGAGWIYLISTRELPDLLKIGMTTRTVEERLREINGATGVAFPFGVRRCWRVDGAGPLTAALLAGRAFHIGEVEELAPRLCYG